MKGIAVLVFLAFAIVVSFAQKYTISGYVYDNKSKETLIGATIFDSENKTGCVTNAYGFYSFSTKAKRIEVSFVGYEKQIIDFTLAKDTIINIYLSPASMLQEVVVVDKQKERRFVNEAVVGKIEISPQVVSKMPTLTGESDLLKAVQMLPGVKSGTEGTTGLYVRGGNSDQNLYLIDGIEVYNPNHLMGFISAFNTEAIKNIDFYKGGFPAQFGGRVSSVMDIRTKDGNNEKLKGDISVGLISAKLNIEGPIWKDKTTFNLSFRRTYLDLLLRPLIWYATKNKEDNYSFAYHFYDLNAKIKHRFNSKNSLTLSFYKGEDAYNFTDEYKNEEYYNSKADISWGNTIGTLDWAHQYNSKLFGNLSFSFNKYLSKIDNSYDAKEKNNMTNETIVYHSAFEFNSGIEDYTLKKNFTYYLNNNNTLNFGANYIFHHYTPEITRAISLENNQQTYLPYELKNNKNANEFILYFENVFTWKEKFSAQLGLHSDYYKVENTNYFSLQPRASLRYSILENFSLKLGYANMNQNIHLLSNGMFSLPTDLWLPVTERIKPITSDIFSFGAFYQIKKGINIGLEFYYKYLDNVIDYKDGISSFSNSDNWEDKVAQGRGRAYGLEVNIQKNNGILTGWISYTLSWSKRQYPNGEINNGNWFYDRFDARHQLNFVASAELNNKWDITLAFVINSGQRTNVPIAQYYNLVGTIPEYMLYYPTLINVYGERNNFKMPTYHRLDLGINYKKKTKKGEIIWSFNVYNAMNHKNAFFVFTTDKPNKLRAFSIMPIIPTLSYTYKF
ncbi:MAG: TonB-dependent receptor [Bacteroidota bacterium]|nr:TonB-dependent receptor [Bacteroidota bacterium]